MPGHERHTTTLYCQVTRPWCTYIRCNERDVGNQTMCASHVQLLCTTPAASPFVAWYMRSCTAIFYIWYVIPNLVSSPESLILAIRINFQRKISTALAVLCGLLSSYVNRSSNTNATVTISKWTDLDAPCNNCPYEYAYTKSSQPTRRTPHSNTPQNNAKYCRTHLVPGNDTPNSSIPHSRSY